MKAHKYSHRIKLAGNQVIPFPELLTDNRTSKENMLGSEINDAAIKNNLNPILLFLGCNAILVGNRETKTFFLILELSLFKI